MLRQRKNTKFLTAWHWWFNLSATAVFITLFLNWPELLLHLRLAADNSIFQNGGLAFLVMALLLLLTATIHELGHLLAGYLVGFQFQVLVVGPVRLARENGRLRFSWQRSSSWFNGLAASLPQEMDHLDHRLLYFALGGPLASLLLSLASLGGVLFLDNELPRMLDYLWVWECCLFTAVVSYFFLLTVLRPGPYYNGLIADGGRILMIAQKSIEAERWRALVKLNVADMSGIRPSNWQENWLEQALSQPDNSLDYLTALIMNYHHHLDSNQPQKASFYLETALKLPVTWETGLRARLTMEKAYLAAAFLHNLETARESFNQIKKKPRQANALYWRAKAAVLFLEGKTELAIQAAFEALAALEKELKTGLQKAEKAWLKNMIGQDVD